MEEVKEGVIIEVKAVPGSKKRKLKLEGEKLVCYLKNEAERGKANEELIKILESLFSCKVEIISGKKSRRKRVLIRGARVEEVEKKLKGIRKKRLFFEIDRGNKIRK